MKKIAIVTGSAGNLGQAVVRKLVAENYQVIGTVTAHDVTALDLPVSKFEPAVVDLASEDNTAAFVKSVIEKYKTIDTAILTVGGFAMGKIADTSAKDVYKQYQLNFETAYTIARPVFVQMIKQNAGRIFLVGSKPGMNPNNSKDMTAYGLAKSLIFHLAGLMNEEAKGYDVVTNVIVPGTIDTPQNRKAMPEADFNNWVNPEEIASIICYYSSDAARSLREPIIKIYGNS
jgi:NAD(P)-dependent dehydrogenase (short-subunit alcohol dehydrogenase family)